jgi:acetyl esterase/lipase
MIVWKMGNCVRVLVVSATCALMSSACVVPDPGPGDTLPAAPPVLPPPLTVSYRHLDANPIIDPSLYPDAELIDLYAPPTVGPQTGLLLWIHGGGWAMGDRTGVPAWVLQQVPRGYLVASIGYRLAFYDANGAPQNTFPAAVEDVKLAVRFMKALGAWLGTSPRVILAGASAGGHLASFVGATPGQFEPAAIPPSLVGFDSTLSSVVNIVGPTDLRPIATPPTDPSDPGTPVVAFFVAMLLGCPQPTLAAPYTCPPGTDFSTASVIPWLDATDPPTYFGYGGIDNWVPAASQGAPAAVALYAATGEKLMSWYDLAETAWHDLDGTKLNMTALQGFLDATRDGRFDQLRASLPAAQLRESADDR